MSQTELDELQARIDALRSRLLTPAASPMACTPVTAPEPLLVLKCRRSWTFAPFARLLAVLALFEMAAFVITGHGFVNGIGLFLCLAWWPSLLWNGELRVHDKGVEIPATGGTVLPWADMERIERRRWGQVPALHFDAIIGSTTKVYGDRREVVIPLTPYMIDWTTGPFADLLRTRRPQLLSR